MKVNVIIEKGTDSTYDVYLDSDSVNIPVWFRGTGASVKEAMADFYSSYEEAKDICIQDNKELPTLEFNFNYDTVSFLNYYSKFISLAGMERITGINRKQLSHYLTGTRNPSKKTICKIEEKLHIFAKELLELSLG